MLQKLYGAVILIFYGHIVLSSKVTFGSGFENQYEIRQRCRPAFRQAGVKLFKASPKRRDFPEM